MHVHMIKSLVQDGEEMGRRREVTDDEKNSCSSEFYVRANKA